MRGIRDGLMVSLKLDSILKRRFVNEMVKKNPAVSGGRVVRSVILSLLFVKCGLSFPGEALRFSSCA